MNYSSVNDGRWSDAQWRRALADHLRTFPTTRRLHYDPISVPRRAMARKRPRSEIETIALFSALLAYGKVEMFLSIIRRVAEICDYSLRELVWCPPRSWRWPAYRFATGADLCALARAIVVVSELPGGLLAVFRRGWLHTRNIWEGIKALRENLLDVVPATDHTPGLRHLLPAVGASAAKRWMLFLRWMVRRDDGVDLGLWKEISPSALILPLDRHILTLARDFGWTHRQSASRRAAEEITAVLRRFDPLDPVRYDFALCHMGISGDCRHGRDPDACRRCRFRSTCRRGNGTSFKRGKRGRGSCE